MCHHVHMAIDWDEVVDETESETDEPAAAEEVDERTVGLGDGGEGGGLRVVHGHATVVVALAEFAEIDEAQMDVATALNGSGPAFVFYFLQAMKEAGVEEGLPATEAETLAAQTFKGAAETVHHSEKSVDELIDAVCSPNGTTIEGMEVLWDSDVEREVGDALSAARRRSAELAEEAEK